ncbi:cytochrome P450 76A1-like [Nicotiana sylvestris]|uniref:Cytochrome P450 76A1-like n=1 Tax=Nicotiana sylvestris TaxID=4096 RepID=A0A1U7XAL1_NICSY|nr:PREDICTED: cytochrome P450 76A1-like [Nicotiana sylvestris]
MELEWSYIFWSIIILLPALILLITKKKSSSSNIKLPPGPPGLPIFGNMFDLAGSEPYKKAANLKQKYGPIVWLKIGPSMNTIIVQTAQAAAELFKNHDVTFADRYIVDVNLAHNNHQASMALAPYGNYWRMLRRICTVEMFVNKRINETVQIRRKSMDKMLQWIEKQANLVNTNRSGIEVTRYVFLASFNMLGNLILSKDLADPESEKGSEFFKAMTGIMQWAGVPNISDIFSCLKRFDIQDLRKKMEHDMGKAKEITFGYLKERIEEGQKGGEKRKDLLDVLLDFEGSGKDEQAKLSEHEITMTIMEFFLAGTETTSSSVELALTELLRNPEAMAKVKAEISEVVGPNRKFEESDIDNLPYMQAVLKESLRLHPPLPFLIPRRATQDTKFMGYDVPKGTQVLVNVWSIGRDPECWNDPFEFKPERFLGSNVDVKGQNYELIPFGAGRRMCVGLSLGHRMMHFAFGSLLHEFNWELPDNVTPKSMNMDESMGVTARKKQPLKVIPNRA